jgi:phage shock protein A
MRLIKENFEKETLNAWQTYLDALEKSIDQLEKDIDEASAMSAVCTSEWCEATEHVIDELNNALFSISEPRWASDAASRKLKQLKRRVYDLYADYKAIPKAA